MNILEMKPKDALCVLGPCGNVNYVTDVALEQDTLTSALIDLARVLQCGNEESLPSLTALIVGGLVVTDGASRLSAREVRQVTARVVEALMHRSHRRMHPPFHMDTVWRAPADLAAMKTLLLLGMRGTAANAARMIGSDPGDRVVGRHFVAALAGLANADSVGELLPFMRDIGRVNFRCLDRLQHRRPDRVGSGCRRLAAAPAAGGPARLSLQSEDEAEDAVRALATQSRLRALKSRALSISVALGWYGPASVCMLLTLLALGIRDIQLGPERPTFIPQSVTDLLQDYFGLESKLFAETA